jgi:hypothetical protein
VKNALLVAALAASAASGQVLVADGTWEFRAGNTAPFPITIRKTEGYRFTGAYAGTLVFNGTGSSNSLLVMITWLNASANIPGSSMAFWGTLTSDGKAMVNGYAATCQSCARAATWTAHLIENPAPAPKPKASPKDRPTRRRRQA